MLTMAVPDSTSTVVNSSTFCISSTSFNPEKFQALLDLMMKRYLENLDPTKALEAYLSIHTTGIYQTFQDASFPESSVAGYGSVLKELADILGPEMVNRYVSCFTFNNSYCDTHPLIRCRQYYGMLCY